MSAMGAFGRVYARLVEQGYAVVPIAPGTKKPGLPCNGHWIDFKGWTTYSHKGCGQKVMFN
jgi:hypothetical protein